MQSKLDEKDDEELQCIQKMYCLNCVVVLKRQRSSSFSKFFHQECDLVDCSNISAPILCLVFRTKK